MNFDTVSTIAANLWDLATWRYLPLTIILLTPLVIYYLVRPYTSDVKREKDAETGADVNVIHSNFRQTVLLTCMVVGIPLSVWFFYLFLINVGV